MPQDTDASWKSAIVTKIIDGRTEEALVLLSQHYCVVTPGLKVGRVKGYSSALGCYQARTKTIYISKNDYFNNPFVILHEFYHHLRTRGGVHRGVEKGADRFAEEFIQTYVEMGRKQHF